MSRFAPLLLLPLLLLLGCDAVRLIPSPGVEGTAAPAFVSVIVPGRYVVVYRNGKIPNDAEAHAHAAGARLLQRIDRFGLSIQQMPGGEVAAEAKLAAQPDVQAVLRDRYVYGHSIGVVPAPAPGSSSTDDFYTSQQGWAVRQAGGYGANVPGGPSTGPWNVSMGAGIRVAVLDSGIDATHPDLLPNLALNLSEVNQNAQSGLPSPCDDGSPQDQQGHGTWSASLAAGALGTGTGKVIGVAPQATLLNIKVLERLPSAEGADLNARCGAGQAGGFLSWVLQGMNDAIVNKANVISLSLGSIVDFNTGDGAGWKAAFDRVTHAAGAGGIVIVAAAGNEGIDLSGHYLELPAQARDVLPVVASTNAACMEKLSPNAVCTAGPVTRPYYSNFGITDAIAAPGGSYPNVSDTGTNGWVRGACSSSGCFNLGASSYVQAMGTSASAPLVAGVAALLRAAHPSWTATQIIAALRSSATGTSTMSEPQVNAAAALALP